MRLTTRHDRLVAPIQLSPASATAIVFGALLLIFGVDRATDAAPVQHLYYLPIIFAGSRFKMRGGVAAALAAILLYHVANPHLLTLRYGERDLVQIALFLAVGMITAKLTVDADRLRRLAHDGRSDGSAQPAVVRSQAGDDGARVTRAVDAPLALLVLDVDRLKSLNDQYGHLTGAEAVRTVGRVIGQGLPPGAVACRYGGDEFVHRPSLQCTSFQAHRIADDLRRAVHETAPVLAGRAFPAGTLSISVGASCAPLDLDATSKTGVS